MDEDFTPPTQPFGALVPPPKVPRTAVGAATPAPLPQRSFRDRRLQQRMRLRRVVERTFDAIDEIADGIAYGLGLREK